MDQVYVALSTLPADELRLAGISSGDLNRVLMGDRIDSTRLKAFIADRFGAGTVRTASPEDREYYMLRADDPLISVVRIVSEDVGVDANRAMDALRSASPEELRGIGIRQPFESIRSGDEIHVPSLRAFVRNVAVTP